MKERTQRIHLLKVLAIWGGLLGLIVAIRALQTMAPHSSMTTNAAAISSLTNAGSSEKGRDDDANPSSKKRDYLQVSDWPDGMRLYRDWWTKRQAAIYIAEMDRKAEDLRFGVDLANNRILERETISSMARRLARRDIPLFAGVNGSFGIRQDGRGRGGIIFNLHIQDRELVSIPPRRDWWGYSPPSSWGETSFGVTPEGKFLLDAVQLNGVIRMDGKALKVDCINQIRDSECPAVIYTPRFGKQTLTRGGYEVVLRQIKLPITGKYRSRFVIDSVNPNGNSVIPRRSVVLSIHRQLVRQWQSMLSKGASGELQIELSPAKWQRVIDGIGGNIRLLRNGKIEPELVAFDRSGGYYNRRQRNAAQAHPRSALGFNDDKLFLAVVDGRQMGYSMGMTVYEMAEFLRDLGAKHAINFDGGSSSTLWALDGVVNRPSHGYERRVFNVAMITTRAASGKTATHERDRKVGKLEE